MKAKFNVTMTVTLGYVFELDTDDSDVAYEVAKEQMLKDLQKKYIVSEGDISIMGVHTV